MGQELAVLRNQVQLGLMDDVVPQTRKQLDWEDGIHQTEQCSRSEGKERRTGRAVSAAEALSSKPSTGSECGVVDRSCYMKELSELDELLPWMTKVDWAAHEEVQREELWVRPERALRVHIRKAGLVHRRTIALGWADERVDLRQEVEARMG